MLTFCSTKKPRVSKNEFAVAPLVRATVTPGISAARSLRLVGARSTITALPSVVTAETPLLIGLRLVLVETRPMVRSDWVDDSWSAIVRRVFPPATSATSSLCAVW